MFFEVTNLRVDYGGAEVLRGLSLKVEEGTIISLIGANGAGKTTLLKTISGLKILTSGEVYFQSKRIDGLSPQEIVRLGIAHIPEGRLVFAKMSVRDNLSLGAYLRRDKHGVARDLNDICERFPVLKERYQQLAGSLSGGEQQMLAIARALMSAPKLLLMDEPSLGLSPMLVREVGRIITDINQRGVSIILVEQILDLVLRISHRIYILETGTIVAEGEPKDLISNERVKAAYLSGGVKG